MDCMKSTYASHFLIRYPHNKKHDPDYSKFRSVIYKTDGTMVCFSPPKSIPLDSFTHDLKEVVCEEFVEGTMMNVFYDGEWRIATKSMLGAECTFNSSRTFAEMFADFHFDFETLEKKYCYSFVMQHPDNQIILPVERKLWLVAVYEIVDNVPFEREIPFLKPRQFSCASYEEAKTKTNEVFCKGMMLKCKGERSKIKNEEYERLKKIKGHDTFRYHYLHIRNTPQLETYLSYFPWDRPNALLYEKHFLRVVNLLLSDYIDCFIRKTQPLKEYVRKNYLYELHQIYVTELRINKQKMYKKKVIEYMNALPTPRLYTLLKI